jgi:hypothetical protein
VSAFLFLALSMPNADDSVDDPDRIADDIVLSLRHDGHGRVMVGGIPSPQWLTPATLANLRAAAAGRDSEGRCPLATDLVDFVDGQPQQWREIVAHIACCEPCRRGVVNIIQTSAEYPDLFDRKESS